MTLPQDAGIRLLYIPCPDEDTALDLARRAVEAKLAACANLLPGMKSVYAWQGRLEMAEEVVLILKTAAARASELSEWVENAHPYEVPAILTLVPAEVNSAYANWLFSATLTPDS